MDIEGQPIFFKSSEHMDEVPGGSVTLVVTSPPYWNVRDYEKRVHRRAEPGLVQSDIGIFAF
jgi:DNA modification methylase